MIVTASAVSLSATHASERLTARRESLEAWVGDRPRAAGAAPAPIRPSPPEAPQGADADADGAEEDGRTRGTARDELDLAILRRTFRLERSLTTAAHEVRSAYADGHGEGAAHQPQAGPGGGRGQGQAAAPPPPEGWGLRYDLTETTVSAERSSFAAAAHVTTADGRTIDVAASLSMERVEVTSREVHVLAGDAARQPVDPLVLNLSGAPAAFQGAGAFDLDGNGRAEQVATLAPGSAWLAMDRNGNGTIDSGAELFGPSSGSGFGELAALDQDGSGWVDEGDAAFRALSLWSPGTGTLSPLAAAGVGALYTGSAATPFTLQAGGRAVGAVAETGLFLRENGSAGTIQHVDLLA